MIFSDDVVTKAAKAAYEQGGDKNYTWEGASDGVKKLYLKETAAALGTLSPTDIPKMATGRALSMIEDWIRDSMVHIEEARTFLGVPEGSSGD